MNETSICNFLTNSSEKPFFICSQEQCLLCPLFAFQNKNLQYPLSICHRGDEMIPLFSFSLDFGISSFLEYFLHLQTQTK